MSDFIAFNEGRNQVENQGWPSTVYFALSTKPCSGSGAHVATDTAASFGQVSGTGYAQASQSEPTASGLGSLVFTQMSWDTSTATDWTSPKTIVAIDKSGGGNGKLVCAWNLISGGTAARDMSQAHTTLNVTPTYAPTNP